MTELPNLPVLVQDSELLSEVITQLEKDLGESHPDLVSLEYSNVEDLIETVADLLWELHSRSQENLFNLLYRIDLPETKVQETINSEVFEWHGLAELILKRELQKVVLRKHFSK
ncbi:MAG: hypothetical protein ACI9P8_000117 [Bacteroidia bacterium]|jgi:hypothetical protein